MNILPNTKYPVFYIEILKSTLMIVQSAGYELGDDMNSLLNCLFCGNYSFFIYRNIYSVFKLTSIIMILF